MELEKAKKREQEELEKAREIEKELKSLTEREEKLRSRNDQLTQELEELQPCADYLQSVVESCQMFDNVEAILHRHESLSNMRSEYLAKYQELMSGYGKDEAQLQKLLEIRKSYLIDSTMKFNERLTKIKQTKKLNEYRNTTLMKDVQRIEDKNTELAAIRNSIKTIYNRALSRSSATADQIRKKQAEVSEEGMLEYIENRFHDLKEIIREAQPGNYILVEQVSGTLRHPGP
jgi:DNA repair ATPase RecN